MQTEKKKGVRDAATDAAQAAHATMCRTTVIASADAYEDRTARLVELVKGTGHRGRFDLLTVLRPERLTRDARLFDQVAKDAALAIKLHHGEQILVALYGDPAPIVAALKRRPEFQDGGVEISGVDLRGPGQDVPPQSPILAVTCMDFRQHDDTLRQRIKDAFGLPSLPSIFAVAGAAKELVDGLPRGRRVIKRLQNRDGERPIERIVLTCHTDCGAMGGDAAPAFCAGGRPDPDLQLKVLGEYLKASALSFRIAFPKARIETGVVRLKDGRLDAVLPVRA